MTKSIGIQAQTYKILDDSKAPGQSFDGKIKELLEKTGEMPQDATA